MEKCIQFVSNEACSCGFTISEWCSDAPVDLMLLNSGMKI